MPKPVITNNVSRDSAMASSTYACMGRTSFTGRSASIAHTSLRMADASDAPSAELRTTKLMLRADR